MKPPDDMNAGAPTRASFVATAKRARELLDAGRLRKAFDTLDSLRLTASQAPEAAWLQISIARKWKST